MAHPVPVFGGVVKDGKVRLEERSRFLAYLKAFEGMPIQISIKRRQSQRSLDQNAWAWGVAYPILAAAWGYDADEHEDLHYGLVAKCFGEHFDKRMGAMVPNKRSSRLSTTEFSEYMEWLVRYAAKAGVSVPLPGEAEAA